MNTYEANKSSIEAARLGSGEFGHRGRPESPVTIAALPAQPSGPRMDEDGTEWQESYYGDGVESRLGNITVQVSPAEDGGYSYKIIDYRHRARSAYIGSGTAATEAEACEAGKADRAAALDWGHLKITTGSSTPWGPAQYAEAAAPGIYAIGTSSHGGMKVTAARNRGIDPRWRSNGGFYEEDCEQAIPIITYPSEFDDKLVANAHETARRHLPAYAQVVEANPERYPVPTVEG